MQPFYLDGCWVETTACESVYNPWSGEKLAEICVAGAGDVESAVASSHAAFQQTRRLTADARASALEKIHHLILERRQEFVDVIVAEAGKPVTFAVA